MTSIFMVLNKKPFLFVFILLFTQNIFSQNIQVTSGPEQKNFYSTQTTHLLGSDETGVYSLRYKDPKAGMWLDKHDLSMKLISQQKIMFPIGHNYTYFLFQSVKWLNHKIYLFYSRYDRALGGNVLSVSVIDTTGSISETKELSRVDTKTELKRGSFNIVYSTDNSKIGIQKSDEPDFNKRESLSFEIYDLSLNKLIEKRVKVPIKATKYDFTKTLIDNNGNVHIVVKVYISKNEKDDTRSISNYEIYSYFHQEDTLKQFDINLGDISINQIAFRLDTKNNLIGAGLYSHKSNQSNTGFVQPASLVIQRGKSLKGTFLFIIDAEKKEVVLNSYQEFSKEFISQFKNDKLPKEATIEDYTIRELFIRDNGSCALVAENNSFETPDYTSNSPFKPIYNLKSYEQNFNDILIATITPDGKSEWTIRIPKKQTINSVKYKHLGFGVFMIDNKICILFNDNPKNLSKDASLDKPVLMGDETVAIYTLLSVSEDGKYSKTGLFQSREKLTIINPKFNLQLSPKSILLYGDGYIYYRLVKIDF